MTKSLNKILEMTNPIMTSLDYRDAVNEFKGKIMLEPLSENITIFFSSRLDFKYIEELGIDHLCNFIH